MRSVLAVSLLAAATVFAQAIADLQKAVDLDPHNVNARLRLAEAYLSAYIPGATSPENSENAERAASEFQRVIQIDPNNKQAYYSLGVIDWAKSYPVRVRARPRAGMRAEDAGRIVNAAERQALKSKYDRVIEDGIANLERAIQIDPNYDEAMEYMNLLIRERADLRDTPEEYSKDIASADEWVQRALETKRQKAQNGRPQQIRVGAGAQQENLVRKVDPVYPAMAEQNRIQGVVRFTALIGKDGHVKNLQLISGHPLLVAAALEAVRQWVYKPTLLNGEPVEVLTQIEVGFSLPAPPQNQAAGGAAAGCVPKLLQNRSWVMIHSQSSFAKQRRA